MNFSVFILGFVFCPFHFVLCQQNEDDGPILLEPQFDSINLSNYILNDKLLRFQLKCVLFNGPCDAVGHWIRPRVKAALLGDCLKCTETQANYMQTLMSILINYFPEIHRAAVAKYINGQGISISEEDQNLIQKINSSAGWAEFKSRLQVVAKDMKDGKISGLN